MPRIPNALKRPAIYLGLAVAVGWSGLTACTENMGAFDQIHVSVTGTGTGAGNVSSNDPNVNIDCDFPSDAGCSDTFSEAGNGGQFNLIATPSTGSVFGAWTGCNSTSGNVCTLSFPAGEGNVNFSVSVQFDPAGASNTVTLYNNSSVSAYLVGPSETAGAGNLVASHGFRDVAIPTTVGSQSIFSAYLSLGTLAVSATCSVTATAWQNGTHPLVMFDNADGNRLVCSEGLVGL